MKRGFSLIVAIFTILIVSLIAGYIFYASSTIAKTGNLQYQREQAALLARSYTEYAVMAVQGHNRESNGNCVEKIIGTIGNNPNIGNGYNIEVDIAYIGNSKYLNNCNNNIVKLDNAASEDTLIILVDVYVRYKDVLHPNKANAPWITYHKRSLQKI